MGILTFSDVIYALSLCCLFLFLCVNAFEKLQKVMRGAAMKSRKKLSAPLSAAIAFLLFLSVIFAAESLTSALTLRLDMTEDGLYTLSDTTVDVLSL